MVEARAHLHSILQVRDLSGENDDTKQDDTNDKQPSDCRDGGEITVSVDRVGWGNATRTGGSVNLPDGSQCNHHEVHGWKQRENFGGTLWGGSVGKRAVNALVSVQCGFVCKP